MKKAAGRRIEKYSSARRFFHQPQDFS